MKIVDVSAFYAPHGGGVRTYVECKIAYAERTGIDLVVVIPGEEDGEDRRPGGARVISVASPKLIFDGRYRYFKSAGPVHDILDAEQPDIVEASSPWRTASIVADWKGPARKALFMHADPMAVYAYRWFGQVAPRDTIDRTFAPYLNHLRRAAAKFDTVVCCNPDLEARLRHAGIPNVTMIPLGIEPNRFSPSLRSAELRAKMLSQCHLPENARLLVAICRLSAEKRLPMVIEAVSVASAREPVGLIIIGVGRDRPTVLKAIGGNPHIRLIDGVRDRALLARMLASADGFIHGCESETYGIVVAEAASSGVPLILPDEGGAVAFADPSCSVSYRAANPAALVRALDQFLDHDPAELLAAAAHRAEKVFCIDNHFDNLIDTYQQCRTTVQAA
jgi:alpha-1,6-mannosyltransferase